MLLRVLVLAALALVVVMTALRALASLVRPQAARRRPGDAGGALELVRCTGCGVYLPASAARVRGRDATCAQCAGGSGRGAAPGGGSSRAASGG